MWGTQARSRQTTLPCHAASRFQRATRGDLPTTNRDRQESVMLRWSLVFLVLALVAAALGFTSVAGDRKSTRLNSSHSQISYAVFCLKKKNGACERSPKRF